KQANQDCTQAEGAVTQLAEARGRQTRSTLAGLGESVSAFFARGLQNVQSYVMERQQALVHAVTGAIQWISQAIASGIRSAQAWIADARNRLQARIESISAGVQSRVSGITGRITGFIDSVDLPDIPGVGRIRGLVSGVLGRGGNLVNRALSVTTRGINALVGVGFSALNALLSGFSNILTGILGLVSTLLSNLMQVLAQAFNLCMTTIASLLQRLLDAIVLPLFARIGDMLLQWIARLRQRAILSLRRNREQALEAIADTLSPRVRDPDRPVVTLTQAEAIRQLHQEAQQRARLIVQLFDVLAGGGVAMLLGLMSIAAERLRAAIVQFITGAVALIGRIVARVLDVVNSIVQMVRDAIAEISAFLQRSIGEQLAAVGSFLVSSAGSMVDFAGNAYSRLSGSVTSLVGNFLRSAGGGVSDADTVVGPYTNRAGPIRLLEGPIVIPKPGTIIWIIKKAAPLVVAAVRELVRLVGPTAALIIIVIVLVIILLILLYLLYLLLKWLYDVITKPKKPKPTKRVIRVDPKKLELGVGGFDLRTSAKIAPGSPANPPLNWKINPGSTPPAGVSVVGLGRHVKLRSVHPSHGTVLGGTNFVVRAALVSNPLDYADSKPITLVQILEANYSANPPLATVTLPGNPGAGIPPTPVPAPDNSGEPNRDGVGGNKVDVNAFPRPTGRRMRLEFRRSLGASASAMTVTPSKQTGDIGLRIRDTETGATLDETLNSTAGGATLMADLMINAVPTGVASLSNNTIVTPPYGIQNIFNFSSSDSLHPPLTRVVGELVTDGGDQFTLDPPNGGFNPGYRNDLAAPANQCGDTLGTPFNIPHRIDGRDAIDVNRFVGPGVPQLPRTLNYKQKMVYVYWLAGTVVSRPFASGNQIRRLIGAPGNFQFTSDQVFGSAAAPQRAEPYVGNPLIEYSNMLMTLTAPGATALAADNASTGNLTVNSTVPSGQVNWRVINGDMSFITANPVTLPGASTLRAGNRAGRFTIRVEDVNYANRRLDGEIRVAKVTLDNIRAADPVVPPGTLSTTVSLDAQPGGRTLNWSVDAAAAAAGVTVNPPNTG
ncbi:MAG TPA: hypothetical protein VN066_05765, partial [Rhodocyclaceae bacterium]|nr:hypothetical protein [Rhodocyclaceae bacterium]